jgi:hypothetical protein
MGLGDKSLSKQPQPPVGERKGCVHEGGPTNGLASPQWGDAPSGLTGSQGDPGVGPRHEEAKRSSPSSKPITIGNMSKTI